MDRDIKQFLRNVTHLVPAEELKIKLQKGVPLRIKLGVDPTAQHVTLGWAVVFRKLREFQLLGHKACLVIGDFTAQIGDPTGKSKTRPQLTKEQVSSYTESILQQVFKILDPKDTIVYYNSEWLEKLTFKDLIQLSSKVMVARILERDDFTLRLKECKPLALHEILYPLCQAYDSVQIEADVELGGNDQLFNNLLGRTLMGQFGMEPQVVMTCSLLVGTDGKEKMSQSLGNYIGITESPNEIFGKTMSIPDSLIFNWFELATEVDVTEIENLKKEYIAENLNPRDAKIRLAKEIVALYHDKNQADEAEKYFINTFSKKQIPQDIPELPLKNEWFTNNIIRLNQLLVLLNLVESSGEAKRLIEAGAVSLDGEKCGDISFTYSQEQLKSKVLKVGKHQFRKLI